MDISDTRRDDVLVVSLKGRLDGHSAEALDENLGRWIEQGEKGMVLDFSELEYISSAGLRTILSAAKRLKPSGGRLVIAGASGVVRDVLDLTGLAELFHASADVDEALPKVSDS